MLRAFFVGMAVLCGASCLLAQEKPEKPVISVKTTPPVVVKTVPQSGAIDVDPGLAELSVTYSKDMQDQCWSWVQASPPENYPQTTGKPHYLEDHRTCVLPVRLEPGRTYLVWLNMGKFNAFMDTDRQRAVPYLLVFQTKPQAATQQ